MNVLDILKNGIQETKHRDETYSRPSEAEKTSSEVKEIPSGKASGASTRTVANRNNSYT